MNNPYLSSEIKQEAFLIGVDISKIVTAQEPDLIKNIYTSVMDGFEMMTSTDIPAVSCICNLVNSGCLPESCELDLIKKYINGEINSFEPAVKLMLKNTQHYSVSKEVMEKKPVPALMAQVVLNKNTPNEVAINIFRLVKELNKSSFSYEEYIDSQSLLLNIAKTADLTEDLCDRIANHPSITKNRISKALCKNPKTPSSFLQKVIKDDYQSTNNLVVSFFNLKSKGVFPFEEAQEFLNTVSSIAERTPISFEEQFLPSYFSESNEKLRHVLQEIINDVFSDTHCKEHTTSYLQTLCEKYATSYLQTLDKKDSYEQVKDMPLVRTESLSTEQLLFGKQLILHKVFCTDHANIGIHEVDAPTRHIGGIDTYHTENFYDVYAVLEQANIYHDLYEEVTNEIEKRRNFENNKEDIETTER